MNYIIKFLIYIIGILGLWILVGDWIKEFFSNKKRQIKIKTRLGNRKLAVNKIKIKNAKINHFSIIIDIAHKGKISLTSYVFILVSIFILINLYFFATNNLNLTNIFYSLLVSLGPIIFTFAKFHFNRINTSYEGERLITEFINQYNINNGNIIETIDLTAQILKGERFSKRALSKLSFNLKNARNEEEIDNCINVFAYSINTQWGILLAQNIRIGLNTGVNIIESLEDILQEIKHIKNSIEKSKRENNESFIIVLFLTPVIYLLTTYYSLKTVNLSFSYYLKQQLTTSIGIRLLIIMLILYSLSIIMMIILKKPKFD